MKNFWQNFYCVAASSFMVLAFSTQIVGNASLALLFSNGAIVYAILATIKRDE